MILQMVCYKYRSIISLDIIPFLCLNIKCLFIKLTITMFINMYTFDIFYFRFDYDIKQMETDS